MFLLVQDPDTSLPYIQETVTRGDTYTIPGLHYDFSFLELDVAVQVQFGKVSEGLEIGLSLVFLADDAMIFDVPILSPIVIKTPPCSTQGPGQSVQCQRMQELVSGLTPPSGFQCAREDDCKGLRCVGTIDFGFVSYEITAKSVLDSCTDPISYNITIQDVNGAHVWFHPFIHSETVPVDAIGLPQGIEANLTVLMDPFTDDIDYLLTTIKLIIRTPLSPQPIIETFIENGRMPIPPCDHPMTTPVSRPPTSLTPLPGAGDECATWQAISDGIRDDPVFAGNMVCGVNNSPCDGIVCNLTSDGRLFVFKLTLFHCEAPVRLLFSIDDEPSFVYHVATNITDVAVVAIDHIVQDGELKFFVMRRSSEAVELAVALKLPTSDGIIAVPLVQDRIIPVQPCRPQSTQNPSGPMTQEPSKSPTGRPGDDGKPDNSPQSKTSAAIIGAVVGVVAVVVVIAVVLALVWYRRRSRKPHDEINLVENTSVQA
ncbi:uncharacterized protein LOC110977404 isoform X2 [Acanthaster planci]|nr:uncharacterized protein LOC110977404 isoform X2 [Acanthaster planci]